MKQSGCDYLTWPHRAHFSWPHSTPVIGGVVERRAG